MSSKADFLLISFYIYRRNKYTKVFRVGISEINMQKLVKVYFRNKVTNICGKAGNGRCCMLEKYFLGCCAAREEFMLVTERVI